MSRRTETVEKLKAAGANGGISFPPGSIHEAKVHFNAAIEKFQDASARLVESMHSRVYGVVVYGSARLAPETDEYQFVTKLAKTLVEEIDCDIITGGGGGVMEAAPQGAKLAKQEAKQGHVPSRSRNRGIGIELPWEQGMNPSIDEHTIHEGFPTRLAEFMTSNAVYVAPGGIGTALELMMALQLKQVGHVENDFPIIVHPMWKPLLEEMNKAMFDDRVQKGKTPMVSDGDVLKNVVISDDIAEIVGHFRAHHKKWKETLRDKVVKQEAQETVLVENPSHHKN